jgi:hypothetical protein
MRFLVVLLALGIAPTAIASRSCFCKVLCFWTGEDSSDYYKVLDVSCDKSIEMQKELAMQFLEKHVKEQHANYSKSEFETKTKITCYKSDSKKNLTPKRPAVKE